LRKTKSQANFAKIRLFLHNNNATLNTFQARPVIPASSFRYRAIPARTERQPDRRRSGGVRSGGEPLPAWLCGYLAIPKPIKSRAKRKKESGIRTIPS